MGRRPDGRRPHRRQIKAELATFDKWDRYDFDGDGNFNEPDGYIDHFQIVHSGGDQADGDPIRARTRSGATAGTPSRTPARARPDNKRGGTQIGTTGLWIGDYTIQPENGGRSVFFHEYGHDLGLPDDYNIVSGGDNTNEHWTLMAQSRLGAKDEPASATAPATSARGTSCSSAGSTTRSAVGGQQHGRSTSARRSTTPSKPQALVVVAAQEGRRHRTRRRRPGHASSGTAATGDDLEQHDEPAR